MASAKVAITLDQALLKLLDSWVHQGRYPNRSQAIQSALREKVARWRRVRLAEALAKLDHREGEELAEEFYTGEEWPRY